MAEQHIHGSVWRGRLLEVNKSRPIHWCTVIPKQAWSTGNLEVSFMSEELPIQRMGWGECKGYFIQNVPALSGSLAGVTPQQAWDEWVPKIDAPNFDVNTSFGDDERVQELQEARVGEDDNNPLTDDVQGRDTGLDDVQEDTLLSHPKVWDMVDWLDLGPRKFFEQSAPLGIAAGRGMAVTDQTQRYVWNFNITAGMMGSAAGLVGCVLIGMSLPELGASDDGRADHLTERMSPWAHWQAEMEMAMEIDRDFMVDSLSQNSDTFAAKYAELVDFKRIYSVGDDTWQNVNGKVFIHGQQTKTNFLMSNPKHI